MPTVEVTFTPLPAHVRTARLIATAVARRSGVDESLLDEVRLAVGEACSRAVEAHRLHCPAELIRVALTDDGERFEVVVTDAAPSDVATSGMPGPSVAPAGMTRTVAGALVVDGIVQQLPAGVGLAVIAGLADDVRVTPAGEGTSIAMSWKRRAALFPRGAPPPFDPKTLHHVPPYRPAALGGPPSFLRGSSAARRTRASCSLAGARCARSLCP